MLAGNLLIKISTNVAELQSEFNKISKSFENTVKGMQVAMAGVAVGAVFEKWVEAVKEAEGATKQVEAVLRSTGGAAGVTMKQVNQLSDSLSRMSGVDDDVIQGAQALMLTFTRVSKDVFPAAQKAALDMSVALKMDLNSATMLVGKALNDPIKGMTALTKAGVSLTTGQKAVIKSLEETGHHSEAMAMILKELQTEFGGSAAAARDTLGGALQALGTNVENLIEQLGGPDGLRYVIEFVNTAVLEMQDALASAQKYFDTGQAAASDFGKSLGQVGEIGKLAFEATASFARRLINDLVEVGKWVGQLGVKMYELQSNALGKVGIKMPTGSVDEFKKFLEFVRDGSQIAKEDYVGNFFKPIGQEWDRLNEKTKKSIKDMHAAAESAGKRKIKTIDESSVETDAQRKAREKLQKQLDSEHKKVDEILASYKLGTQELENQLNKHGDANDLLKAQQEILKNEHLSVADQNKALAELFKLDQERAKIKKQMAISKEGEELQEVLKDLQMQNAELLNTNKGQKELNISLKAQAEIEKIIKEGKTENLALVNQILAAAKEQEAIVREQQRLESLKKYGEMTQDLADQNEQLRLKLTGQEQLLPLLEAEKKIRDVMNDKTITDADKASLVSQIQTASSQTVSYNQALEQQDRTLKAIKDSSASVTQKIASLQMAFARGQVNVKQYQETLQDLQNDGFKKLKSDAKEFSDTLVGGLSKMFDKGTKFKDVLKEIGKQLLLLGTKKLIAPLAERLFTGIGSKLLGNQYGINQNNPLNLPGFGSSPGGGILAGGATLPTTLAEGPTIVSLLQQIVGLMGGVPMGGMSQGGMTLPWSLPGAYNVQQGGGLLSRLGGLFRGGSRSPLEDMLKNSGLSGGMPASSGGGGLFGGLGGVGRTVSNGALGLLRAIGTPFFEYGGYLSPGQFGIAGENGPELIYGGGSGMGIMSNPQSRGLLGVAGGWQAPWQQAGAYTMGLGGYTGNGMISQLDYASVMANLMQQKYQSGYQAFQQGGFNAPGWYQLQELKAQADRFATIRANGGMTGQMFSRPQFEISSAMVDFNAAAQQWGGKIANVQQLLPAGMINTGQQWMGFQAAGGAPSEASGIGITGTVGPSLQQSSFSIGSSFAGGGYLPYLMPHTPGATAFSTPWNASNAGGTMKSWNAGLGPIRDWQQAITRLNGGNTIPGGNTTGGGWNEPAKLFPPGSVVRADGSIYNPAAPPPFQRPNFNTSGPDFGYTDDGRTSRTHAGWDMSDLRGGWDWASSGIDAKKMIDAMNKQLGATYGQGFAQSAGGLNLPGFVYDNFNIPPGVEAALKNAYTAHNLLSDAMPWFSSKMGIAKQAGSSMLGGITSPNSLYSHMGAIMSQPWANKSMPFSSYPAAASLFGMRGMRTGGRPRVGEPILVGEGGEELFVPDQPGTVVPNGATRDLLGNRSPVNVTINTHTAKPVRASSKSTPRGLEVMIEDAVDTVMQRQGRFRDRMGSTFGVRQKAVGRS